MSSVQAKVMCEQRLKVIESKCNEQLKNTYNTHDGGML